MNSSLPDPSAVTPAQVAVGDGATLRPVFRRTWLWLVLVGILSVGAGAAATWKLAKDLYVYSGTLLFNESYLGSPVYQPPDVFSLATSMKSPRTLNQLREEFGLAAPLTLLERRIEVEARHGSSTVNVELEWENPKDAEKMLNRLMDIAVERSRDFRDTRLDYYIGLFGQDFQESDGRFSAVRRSMLDFYRDEHTMDLDEHMRTLAASLKNLNNELDYAKAKQRGTEESLQRVRQLLATEEVATATTSPEIDAQDNRAARFARAQLEKLRLEEKIKEYQDKESAKIQLLAKRRELERAQQLFERQFISASELEVLQSEVQLLEIQLQEDDHLKQWKDALERVSAELRESAGANLALTGVSSNHLLMRTAELEATLEMDTDVVDRLSADLADRERELARIMKLRPEGMQLAEELEDAEERRDDVGRQLTDFQLLERSDASMFAVMERATPAIVPVISTKKKVFAAITGAAFFAMAGPILFFDFLRQRRRQNAARFAGATLTSTYADTGLPVYSGRSLSTVGAMTQSILAAADRKGYSVLFTSLTGNPLQQETMLRCSEALAERGEPVLLVDPGFHRPTRKEFATLLKYDRVDDQPVASANAPATAAPADQQKWLPGTRYRTEITDVDALQLDGAAATWEAFVRAIPQLAQRYSVILVAGPPSSQRAHVDRLLDDTDAMMLTTERATMDRKGWKLVERCRESGTNILGVSLRRAKKKV